MKINFLLMLPVVGVIIVVIASFHGPGSGAREIAPLDPASPMSPAHYTNIKPMGMVLRRELALSRKYDPVNHDSAIKSYNTIAAEFDPSVLAKNGLPRHI